MEARYIVSCLCEQVKIKVSEVEPTLAHCHCSMCQKFHGAAFSTFVEVKNSNIEWLSGKELLSEYVADNQTKRSFCSNCGSSLLFESKYNRQVNTIELSLACFETVPEHILPTDHIYVESKVGWIELNDGLPQYQLHRLSLND